MRFFLKTLCIGTYIQGAASANSLLTGSISVFTSITIALLVAHAVEAVVMFRHVKRYRGSLSISIVLTILFGFLHWWPLRNQQQVA